MIRHVREKGIPKIRNVFWMAIEKQIHLAYENMMGLLIVKITPASARSSKPAFPFRDPDQDSRHRQAYDEVRPPCQRRGVLLS